MQMLIHCAAHCWPGPGAYEVRVHCARDTLIIILDVITKSTDALLEVYVTLVLYRSEKTYFNK